MSKQQWHIFYPEYTFLALRDSEKGCRYEERKRRKKPSGKINKLGQQETS